MKKVLYIAQVDGYSNFDLPKEMPIPNKGDLLFINSKRLKDEIVAQVNRVSYGINEECKLITVIVKCSKTIVEP